jgi:hypothetical protein
VTIFLRDGSWKLVAERKCGRMAWVCLVAAVNGECEAVAIPRQSLKAGDQQ